MRQLLAVMLRYVLCCVHIRRCIGSFVSLRYAKHKVCSERTIDLFATLRYAFRLITEGGRETEIGTERARRDETASAAGERE